MNKKCILLIEQDPIVSAFMLIVLETLYCDVMLASEAEEALSYSSQ